ncbi:helix-turn-helix domain-containing protein [Streptomyces europaeiscabiei]|uniref:Helix-turn-helix domain-containing protein n=1 Tax=Streptomyces europaeiscabiei TaxID=146819 RepID=A0ABU4NBY9_9ACTN|nr:helix-turn-helix domain-containing protein [Streptomyces europaeiscabiei]MDX3559037.1 helix-turn-helix domain-containing protein [Streptomyces europaeiscabiei]MDX3699612.1 helix-turn-helix domain-containing protein [Streptomyces europaeiscabiei]
MTTAPERGPLTRSELLALPAAVDVETAARAFGIGRTTAYALAKADEFPCKVVRAGKAYRVITADLLRVLHITPNDGANDGTGPEVQSGSAA